MAEIGTAAFTTIFTSTAGGVNHTGKPVNLFGDIVEGLCCHPAYRMLSLRSIPQMPAASLDFTTFTWTAILRRLRQMQITGTGLCCFVDLMPLCLFRLLGNL